MYAILAPVLSHCLISSQLWCKIGNEPSD